MDKAFEVHTSIIISAELNAQTYCRVSAKKSSASKSVAPSGMERTATKSLSGDMEISIRAPETPVPFQKPASASKESISPLMVPAGNVPW